ncbi:MAG: hypothetical protein FJY79_06625 [Candidatus Aminicenantes bacterium]|nr:hypothetical protein [Candidatus Aminicenantes bacterium]
MNRELTATLATLIVLAGPAAGQVIRHETKTINVEIPVRVFKGADFVDGLKLEDFEVYDSGRLQKLDAVYLVRKAAIERREETRTFVPRTARHFTLLFEVSEYDPRLDEALDYFVKSVLIPGDSLVVITPMRTYRMRAENSLQADRERILQRLVELIRRDVLIGNSEYRGLLEDLKRVARVLSAATSAGTPATTASGDPSFAGASFEEQLENYGALLQRLETLRAVDSQKFLDFAGYLKTLDGQKDVFLFYQREFVPKVDPKVLTRLMMVYNDRVDILFSLMNFFDFSRRDSTFDTDFIKKAYSDSSTAVHFLFLSTPAETVPGVVMEERTEDIFEPFREMSRATGGFTGTSSNFGAIMRSAVSALENYYLLYYTPADYRADGAFRNIEVRIKGGGYRLTHRAGYIAD